MQRNLTAKKDYQGGYTLYYVGTSNVVGSYYPAVKKGWYYTPYTHAIVNFEAKTLSEAKGLILRERR